MTGLKLGCARIFSSVNYYEVFFSCYFHCFFKTLLSLVLAGWDNISPENSTDNHEDLSQNGKSNGIMDNPSSKSLLDMLNNASTANGTNDDVSYLKMQFAMAVHEGSVRSLSIAASSSTSKNNDEYKLPMEPVTLLSTGYDESLAVFSLSKRIQTGELKTPSDLGTPTCSSFAPPSLSSSKPSPPPTHALLGLSSGKIILYRKRDWSIQHILAGHDSKGVTCIAVHPSGKMALSGGRDGKIFLWDLMRGRSAFVYKIPNSSSGGKKKDTGMLTNNITVNHLIWSNDGKRYAYCTHEGNITVREMETGEDLLDITLPMNSRPNQICFIGGDDGLFLAAACNDGSLPVFAVGSVDEEEEEKGTRRALMAIEPVQNVPTAADERFKCITSVQGGSGYLVVVANSGGVISIIDLEGAARMLLSDDDGDVGNMVDGKDDDSDTSRSASNDKDDDDDEEELAAEILQSVKIGSGARITCIAVWSYSKHVDTDEIDDNQDEHKEIEAERDDGDEEEDEETEANNLQSNDIDGEKNKIELAYSKKRGNKRKIHSKDAVGSKGNDIELDEEALERARALVSQAKKKQKRKDKKKK